MQMEVSLIIVVKLMKEEFGYSTRSDHGTENVTLVAAQASMHLTYGAQLTMEELHKYTKSTRNIKIEATWRSGVYGLSCTDQIIGFKNERRLQHRILFFLWDMFAVAANLSARPLIQHPY